MRERVSSLLREPDAGEPHVRFDEREVETEQGRASEAPADERAGRIGPPKPPRHFSTLPGICMAPIAKEQSSSKSEIRGAPTARKHQIVTEEFRRLGMEFGGRPLVKNE